MCISRTPQGSSVGGHVILIPIFWQCSWIGSTASTQILIQAPFLPRPPWSSWQRKISTSPPSEQTAPKVGGSPQSNPRFHPHFSNQAKLSKTLETFKMGVMWLTFMVRWFLQLLGGAAQAPYVVSPSPTQGASITQIRPPKQMSLSRAVYRLHLSGANFMFQAIRTTSSAGHV